MNANLRRQIEADCLRGITQLYYYLDERRYEELVALFTADGTWDRGDTTPKGHAALLANMRSRPEAWLVRHVLSNVLVTPLSEDTAEVVSYITVYLHTAGVGAPLPLPLATPFRVLVSYSRHVLVGNSWQIADLRLTPQFEFIGAKPAEK